MTDSNRFLTGALIGGVVAGIAGLLLAPKAGSELVDDILETYDHAQKNGHDFVNAIKEKGSSFARGYTHQEEEEETDYSSFLIGGAIGAVIAGVAALMLAPDSGHKLRRALGKHYDEIIDKANDFVKHTEKNGEHVIDEISDWKETLVELINKLSHKSKGKNHSSTKIDDILGLAQVGLNLFHQLQSRR